MMRKLLGPLLLAAFVVVTLGALAGGFLIIGTPAEQRALSFDKKRSNHLLQIANAVDVHWEHNGQLPASLDEVTNLWVREAADPETGAPYRYQVTGERSYQLCATFAQKQDEPARDPWSNRFGRHGAGEHCFDLTSGEAWQMFRAPPSVLQY